MKKKILKTVVTVLAVLLVILAAAVLYLQLKGRFAEDTLTEDSSDNPFIIANDTYVAAHRMGSDLFPEDTMMSAQGLVGDIKNGLRVDVIETDIQLTKDGELILLHDDTLDRTTNAAEVFQSENNKVIDHTLAELKSLNFGRNFEDADGNYPYQNLKEEEIPDTLRACTIGELLAYLESEQHFKYIIEIKDEGENGRKAVDQLVRLLDEMGITDDVIVASFHEDVLRYIDEAYPECRRNASSKEVVEFYADWLLNKEVKSEYAYDVLDITPRYGIFTGTSDFGQKYGLLMLSSQGFINRAHQAGLAVFYWTVDDAETFSGLKVVDADGIITDDPTLNK